MSRPKPRVLREYTDPKTHKVDEVLEADAIYAVFYGDKPINLRTVHGLINYPGPKYKKVSFSNKGHAINLADKLNEQFNTDQFRVVRMTNGDQIHP